MDDLSRFCCLNSQCPDHGRPGREKPLGLWPLRQGRLDPLPPLSLLRRSFLRAQGHSAVPLSPDQGEGHRRPGAHRRGLRRPPDRATRGRPPRHRDPLHRARPATTPGRPTTSWSRFPPARPRSSSMRSGPTSPRRRSTATAPIRPTTTRGTTGTISPTTPSIAWSSRSCPGLATSRAPRRWWASSAGGPEVGR